MELTNNEKHALAAIAATAEHPKGEIEVKFPGVTIPFRGGLARRLVALMQEAVSQ